MNNRHTDTLPRAVIAMPPGSTSADLQAAVGQAAYGVIIEITGNMSFLDTVTIPVGGSVTIRSRACSHWMLSEAIPGTRHFAVNGRLTLENITLNGGTVLGPDGAVLNQGGGGIQVSADASLHLGTCAEIRNCYAPNGGGVNIALGGSVVIDGGRIVNNAAANGGGIMSAGSVNIINGRIAKNAVTGNGGGVFMDGSAFTMSGGVIENNTAGGEGGGIYTSDANYQNLSTGINTVFAGNYATYAHNPPADASALYPNIRFAKASVLSHPLNNYDINYAGGEPIVWHYVGYEANGGACDHRDVGIPGGAPYRVLSAKEAGICRAGYILTGWNTRPDGSGIAHLPGEVITVNENTILFAQWAATGKVCCPPPACIRMPKASMTPAQGACANPMEKWLRKLR